MKNKQRSVLCLSVLSALTLTACGGTPIPKDWDANIVWEVAGQDKYNELKNEKRSAVYNYYESYMPATLNSVVTFQSEDSRHITNIIDGLVDVDRQGVIIPDLAESWKFNDKSTELTLQIRQNVPWVYNRGNGEDIYKNADGAPVYLSAHDWVTAARLNLDFSSFSETSYLVYMFIEGAEEFYNYTMLQYQKANGYGIISKDKVEADKTGENYKVCLANAGKLASPSSKCGKYIETAGFDDAFIAKSLNVEASVLPSIANFSRVGVKASEDGKTLTYKLTGTLPYFLSVLTYTPYFPVNQSFIDSIGGIENYGTDKDNILSCGAYVMNKFKMGTGSSIKYRRNANYWDVNNVHTYEVNAIQIPANITSSTSRRGYETGTIDGFTVNEQDDTGWKEYVLGKDGTGSLDKPAHPDAHVVDGLGDGSTFAFMLNMDRNASMDGTGVSGTMMKSESAYNVDADGDKNNDTVMNTNKALSVSPAFRELVLKSLDTRTYLHSQGNTVYEQTKTVVNTWVPANFITYSHTAADEAIGIKGNDFVDFTKKAYVDEFYDASYTAENFAKAEAALGYGHVSTGESGKSLTLPEAEITAGSNTWELTAEGKAELETLKTQAKEELKAAGVKLPVVVEYAGLAYSSESDRFDAEFVNATNARLNGCWYGGNSLEASVGRPSNALICDKSQEDNAIFRLIKNNSTNIPNANAYSAISQNYAASIIISGWGPDYSDPLTFANCTITDGDLADALGTSSKNIHFTEVKKQWETYDKLVAEASATADNRDRFIKFAEAEIELLFNLNIVKPIKMRGLGKNVAVSKTIPYRITSATYGVSSYKYKYIEVLTRPISQTEYAGLKAEKEAGR